MFVIVFDSNLYSSTISTSYIRTNIWCDFDNFNNNILFNNKMTKIMQCTCKHEFQDEKYGKNRRVFNKTEKTPGEVWRCTICGKEINTK